MWVWCMMEVGGAGEGGAERLESRGGEKVVQICSRSGGGVIVGLEWG